MSSTHHSLVNSFDYEVQLEKKKKKLCWVVVILIFHENIIFQPIIPVHVHGILMIKLF